MTDPLPPTLPRRYRLAWLLLWFALLGVLAWSAGHRHERAPTAAIGVQLHHPLRPAGDVDSPLDRRPGTGGAIGETAFRQP